MFTHKKNAYLLILVIALAFAFVAACSPVATAAPAAPVASGATAATAQPAAVAKPIIIGVVAPMTGDLADAGAQVTRGIGLAMEEINAKGGVAGGRMLEMKVCDDQCNPQQAAACAQKMVADPEIFAVLGHTCSSCTLAGGPIYEAAKLTVMTVNSTNPKVTEQGWKYLFRSTPTDAQQGAAMVNIAIEQFGAKKIGMIYSNDDYGMGLNQSAKEEITKKGLELVAEETFITGQDKDFSAQLTKIASAKPDVLFVMGQYSEEGMIAKQRVNAGLAEVPFVTTAAAQQQKFIELGGAGAEGAYIAVFYDLTKETPQNQELVKKIVDKYGQKPGEQLPWGYDGAYIFAKAIDAGATKETMSDFLKKTDYQGITGHVTFDAKNQVQGMVGDIQIVKNGEFASFKP